MNDNQTAMRANTIETSPRLLLGTAMWGWTVAAPVAHQLLDEWYAAGLRLIDTATNYPINGNPADWRRSETILLDWIATHGVTDLEVVVKVGSLNNLRSPEHNLSPSFLRLNAEEYGARYGPNFRTYMLHWDNRSDGAEIAASLAVLRELEEWGIRAGLSGIKHPDAYRTVLAAFPDWRIPVECKHNILQSGLDHYAALAPRSEFWVYGINAGGVKLDGSYRKDASLAARGGAPPDQPLLTRIAAWLATEGQSPVFPRSMNEIGLLHAYYDPRVAGILLGPSRPDQLRYSLSYLDQLANGAGRATHRSLLECLTDATDGNL
jgi:aryl-alcohol dehydrogenase-like predicted oxidoreductase